ncbi:MAG: hypothetical protein Q4E54_04710 [Lachnospiraceae bacterium]|nr:hypothetical protein [Lachnospiraceae bacterium]
MISFRTDKKEEKNKKTASTGLKILVVINLCLAVLCAAVFGVTAFVFPADAAGYNPSHTAHDDWYEISKDGQTLGIHLDSNLTGYKWKYGLSNNLIREKHSPESGSEEQSFDKSYSCNMYFTADSALSGDTVITLQYICNQEFSPEDTRVISVHVEDGKLTCN